MFVFTKLFKFLEGLFGSDTEKKILNVVHEIEDYIQKAHPIVSALSAVVTAEDALNPSAAMDRIVAVLKGFVPVEEEIQKFVTANSGIGLATLLHNAALFALSFMQPGAVLNDLSLAVELAYKVFSMMNPAITGKATLASFGKAPAAV